MTESLQTGTRRPPRRRVKGWWWTGVLAVAGSSLLGALPLGAQRPASRPPLTRLILVSGVSGEKQYADAYREWTTAMATAATGRFGIPDSLVRIFAEDTVRGAGLPRARATREAVLAAIRDAARDSREGDRLVIVLFGHGNSQDNAARINLPGPDATAQDFAAALQPATEASVLFVNTASASGEFIKALSGRNRIVITATKSSREQNATSFPRHFVKALTSGDGDTDKDGRVNLLEAFTYATREVERTFSQGNRIATEHPQLDDDGDGTGRGDPSEQRPDGGRARAFFLEPLGGALNAANSGDPRIASLLAERRALESRIEALRARRSSMTEEAYQEALEPLMLELAEKTRAMRALEGKKP